MNDTHDENSATMPGRNGGTLRRFRPGQTGNPGGRPKVSRTIAKAYAELLDCPGADFPAVVEEYRRRRGGDFCGADGIAVGMLMTAASPANRGQVNAAAEIADRTEGKVDQSHTIRAGDTETLIRQLAEQTGVEPTEIRRLGEQLGGAG